MKQRKPLAFDLNRRSRPAVAATATSAPVLERKQVGARIPTQLYRELKARAGLEGVLVQDLVEAAIRQFMTGPKSKGASR